jgi:heat shock protein HslJ
MKKRYFAVLALPFLLAACSTSMNHETTVTTEQAFTEHNWVLTQIDGQAVKVGSDNESPTLMVNKTLATNGFTGCNRYFGQGEYKDGQFRVQKMGMTMMACPDEGMKLEKGMSSQLSDWSKVSINRNTLTLTAKDQTLTFKTSL